MKKGKFNIAIYGINVEIIIVEDEFKTTEFYHKLIKKLKIPTEGDEPCEGFALLEGLKAWVVLAENKLSYSLLQHEISHLSIKIFQFNNINIEEAEENFCLLSGHIAEKIYNIIQKLGCKII